AQENTPLRIWQAIPSLFIPGLGQAIAGAYSRAITIFITTMAMAGLTIWTAAQRARYPDINYSAKIFVTFFFETGAIIIFLAAIYYLLTKYVAKTTSSRAFARFGFILLAVIGIIVASGPLLLGAIPEEKTYDIYGMTALLGAATIAGLWLWNVADATYTTKARSANLNVLIMGALIAMLVTGTQITEIDLEKAFQDLGDPQNRIVLSHIFWPWDKAFVYDYNEVDAEANIQAPCPEGATGPEVNQPLEDEPWIIVTPTCGELSIRDSQTGGIEEFGTLLTIQGGNFRPNENARLEWQNPIGDPFRPRGFGDSEFMTDEDGNFTTELYIPDVTISSTALGDQIHTLRVYQQGERQFTGQISREFRLALEGMLTTIMMGMMATFVGIILSIPVSFLAARNLMRSIRTTLETLVGGIFGIGIGVWLGIEFSAWLKPKVPFLYTSATGTAVVNIVIVLIFVIVFLRLLSWLIEIVSRKVLPKITGIVIVVIGLGALGGIVGYFLGLSIGGGILGLIYAEDTVLQLTPRIGWIVSAIAAIYLAYQAYQIGPGKEVTVGQLIYASVRTVLNILRSIEPLIWAIIGIIWIGPGPFAGFLALTIHSVAALGKLYSEAIESIDPGPIEALQSTGANRLQTIVYAVIPQVLPPFISFTIYRWDINVRMSTVIGLVGGGGIGFLLIQWIRQFQYSEAGIAVWLIAITVAVLDFVSAEIREKFV
ncbi:MAG: ABC transporter permease subunit, partial [Anaerolineales bacterium]